MRRPRRVEACSAAGAALLLLIVPALTLAACSGVSCPVFPPPPTAAPTWPSGAGPAAAITYPAQTATTRSSRAGSYGWLFMPTMDIEVSALGFYDDGQNGLRSPHRAAIFDTVGKTALVEATVGTLSPLDGAFRWESVRPVVLETGHEYVMVWDSPSPTDPEVLDPDNASLALELLYLGNRMTAEGGPPWGFPEAGVKDVILSGNFKYKPVQAAR